jgi:hypothetical protein
VSDDSFGCGEIGICVADRRNPELRVPDLGSNLAQKVEEVASNEVRVFESHFRRNEIDVLIGTASFPGPHTIRVANQEGEQFCDADYVLITRARDRLTMTLFPWTVSPFSIQTRFAG